ncbi:LysR family transcriptional regulator [Celeribacter sp.]|uniref:LysR family transcriptional regulator n=1 Tax=Celeribacter sp. TaxID=1890673 RepID=UPI003A928BB0
MRRLQDIDLKLLRTFQAIVDAGGVSAAQAVLNTSQSTLSTQLVELETRLGFSLCRRGRGGFSLTSEGEKLLESLEDLTSAAERFQNSVASISGEMRGVLRLGVMDAMLANSAWPLHKVIERFSRRARETVVDLTLITPTKMESSLLDGRRDVVIGPFPQRSPSLCYIPLFSERHSIYASHDHPLSGRPEVSIDALAQHGLAATAGELQRFPFIRGLRSKRNRQNSKGVYISATVDQMESHAILIKSGRYVGFLPDYVAQTTGGFVQLKTTPELQYLSPIYLAHRRDAELNIILRSFLKIAANQELQDSALVRSGAITVLDSNE